MPRPPWRTRDWPGFPSTGSSTAGRWSDCSLVVGSVVRVPSLSAPQRRLRVGRPLWLPDTARAKHRYPVLSGQHHTDVAVVGGGLTGALVAHAFASAGISTTVLEAGGVGRGSTAASSATSVFPTSCSGTLIAPITMLAGHRSIASSWAARIARYSQVNAVVNSSRQHHAICGRTLKAGSLPWLRCGLNLPGRASSR